MGFTIRMGIPEMLALWTELQTKHRDGTIKKRDEETYIKMGKCVKEIVCGSFLSGAADA